MRCASAQATAAQATVQAASDEARAEVEAVRAEAAAKEAATAAALAAVRGEADDERRASTTLQEELREAQRQAVQAGGEAKRLGARSAEERSAFDSVAAQLQALGAEHGKLQEAYAALVAAEKATTEQLAMRDQLLLSLIHI